MSAPDLPPAIILAGGLGLRLRPVTGDRYPKPMVPTPSANGERPFLEWPLAWLRREGIREAVVCIGHEGDQIRSHFADGGDFDLTILYDDAGDADTGARCRSAFSLLESDLAVVVCGDVLVDFPLRPFLRELADHPGRDGVLALVQDVPGTRPNTAFDADGTVTEFNRNGVAGNQTGVEAGVLAVRRRALDQADEGASCSLVAHVYPRLISRRSLAGSLVSGSFFDIGTPAGYARFCAKSAGAEPAHGLVTTSR